MDKTSDTDHENDQYLLAKQFKSAICILAILIRDWLNEIEGSYEAIDEAFLLQPPKYALLVITLELIGISDQDHDRVPNPIRYDGVLVLLVAEWILAYWTNFVYPV